MCFEEIFVVYLQYSKIYGMQFKESLLIRLRIFFRFKEVFFIFEYGLWISEDSSLKGLVSLVK